MSYDSEPAPGAVEDLRRTLAARGQSVVLANPPPTTREVLDLLGLEYVATMDGAWRVVDGRT